MLADLYCESLIGLSLLLLVNTLLFTIATAVLDFIVLRGDASRVQQQGINSGKDGAKDKREPKGALGRHYRLCTAITGVILIAVESCGISSSLTSHLMPLHAGRIADCWRIFQIIDSMCKKSCSCI